jgi:hypothetical protein
MLGAHRFQSNRSLKSQTCRTNQCAWVHRMGASANEHSAVAIWKRAIEPEAGNLAPEEARVILRLHLSSADLDRASSRLRHESANSPLSRSGSWTTTWRSAVHWSS